MRKVNGFINIEEGDNSYLIIELIVLYVFYYDI